MAVRFIRPPADPVSAQDTGTFCPPLPRAVLDRHGGRILDPASAAVVPGSAVPRSTVYRPGVLLVPTAMVDEHPSGLAEYFADERGLNVAVRRRARGVGPVSIVLAPRAGDTAPRAVDSWTELQHLRSVSAFGDHAQGATIEHLLFSAVSIAGTPWDISGLPGVSTYSRSAGRTRIPVHWQAPQPARKDVGRRPVVAVPDTGIAPHPWFGIEDRTSGPPETSFLSVMPELQQAILDNQVRLAASTPTQQLIGYWDDPITSDAMLGDVATDAGHGTFITGIIHQAAPDADVLAIRVIHSDGVAYESDVLLALHALLDRVRRAQEGGRPELMVDVVSMSLGYFDEAAGAGTSPIADVLGELTARGVVVVAAAGNDATSRRFYPAALSDRPSEANGGPPVFAVGALNPNGSKALFSNDGPWVNCWATGAGVVSTYPTDIDGSLTAQRVVAGQGRAGLDPDDFSCGFAVWDGTSFAAPLAAARFAAELLAVGMGNDVLSLASVDRGTTVKRAWAALENLW